MTTATISDAAYQQDCPYSEGGCAQPGGIACRCADDLFGKVKTHALEEVDPMSAACPAREDHDPMGNREVLDTTAVTWQWIGDRLITCLPAWEVSEGRFGSCDYKDGKCRYCGGVYQTDPVPPRRNANPEPRYDDGMTDDKAWREEGYYRADAARGYVHA